MSLRRYLDTSGQCRIERLECFEIGLNTLFLLLNMAISVWGPVNLLGVDLDTWFPFGRLFGNILGGRGMRIEVSRWAWDFKVAFHFLVFFLFFLRSVCGWQFCEQIRVLAVTLPSLLPCLSCPNGLCPSATMNWNKTFLLYIELWSYYFITKSEKVTNSLPFGIKYSSNSQDSRRFQKCIYI